MEIRNKVAIVTGAAGGLGKAVCRSLAQRLIRGIAAVDLCQSVHDVAREINDEVGRAVARSYLGDVADEQFCRDVYHDISEKRGLPRICVPAAAIAHDAFAVTIDKESGQPRILPAEDFRRLIEINMLAPTYWALEMIRGIAEDRCRLGRRHWEPTEEIQGSVVFVGSVSHQGMERQIAYTASKRGLEAIAATLSCEARYWGIRCATLHPGFMDTAMIRSLGQEFIRDKILPNTQLGRLVRPEEMAEVACLMIASAEVIGELRADAGWHPTV